MCVDVKRFTGKLYFIVLYGFPHFHESEERKVDFKI
jgi:hypothetical protein